MSNIAAGSLAQLESFFKHRDLLERVIELSRTDRWEVRKEALWVVANIFTTGEDTHIRALVQFEGFAALVDAMDTSDSKVLLVILEAIEVVLKVGSRLSLNYAHMFDELSGLDKLEDLQQHPSEEVYEKAVELLENYFGVDDEEDENLAPTQGSDMFGFGVNTNPAKQLFPSDDGGDKYAPVLGQANYDFGGMQY